jgi:hypothetical protein
VPSKTPEPIRLVIRWPKIGKGFLCKPPPEPPVIWEPPEPPNRPYQPDQDIVELSCQCSTRDFRPSGVSDVVERLRVETAVRRAKGYRLGYWTRTRTAALPGEIDDCIVACFEKLQQATEA